MSSRAKQGVAFAAGSTVASTFVYLLGKFPLEHFHTLSFCFYWYTLGFLYHVVYFTLTRQLRLLHVPGPLIPRLLVLGAVESIANLSFFTALHLLGPALASFLNQLNVVCIVVFGVTILGERFNRTEGIGMVVALLGVGLIRFASPGMGPGFIFILVASLFFATDVILAKRLVARVDARTLSCYRALSLSVVSLVLATARGTLQAPVPLVAIAVLACGAFFGPFLNMLCYFRALHTLEASKVALIRTLQSFLTVAGAYVMFGTLPALRQLAGGLLVVGGVGVLLLGRLGAEKSAAPVRSAGAGLPKGTS